MPYYRFFYIPEKGATAVPESIKNHYPENPFLSYSASVIFMRKTSNK